MLLFWMLLIHYMLEKDKCAPGRDWSAREAACHHTRTTAALGFR